MSSGSVFRLCLALAVFGVGLSTPAHADDNVGKVCPLATPIAKFFHDEIKYDTGGWTAYAHCSQQFFDERDKKTALELAQITKQMAPMQAALNKLAYKNQVGIVHCEPETGGQPEPTRSKKCHALNDAINGLIDRAHLLQHWDDDFRKNVDPHKIEADSQNLPPAPPPPAMDLCQKLQFLRAFNGQNFDNFYDQCVPH